MIELQKASEVGSNENGYYRKWPDGTLECWGTGSVNISSDISWHGLFYNYSSVNIKFPHEFINDPMLIFNIKANEFLGVFVYNSNTVGISSIIAYSGDSYKDANHKYSYHAIGRWK